MLLLHWPHHAIRAVGTLLWVLLVASAAQPQSTPPGGSAPEAGSNAEAGTADSADSRPLVRRVVRQFDFEERDEGNFGEMPRHWYRVRGPGLPRYTRIGFDRAHAGSPSHSLKLELNGGSAAVTLQRGVISAVPGARYLVTVQVRTARVKHSRARLVATYVDNAGKPMPGTRTFSDPVSSNGRWTAIHVEPPRAPDEAGWLTLRLELIQPARFRRPTLGPHQLDRQDLDAAAWFDDVTVYQLPRVELRTQSSTNIIRRPKAPRLAMRVHDLTGQPLSAAVRVYDHRGRLVAEQRRPVEPGRPGQWVWQPPLPGLGWYWADLRVKAGRGGAASSVVGRAVTALLWLGERRAVSRAETERFVIAAEELPAAERSRLPAILNQIGPQSVLLSVWDDEGDWLQPANPGGVEEARATDDPAGSGTGNADPLTDRLIREGRRVMLSFSGVPRSVADQVGGGGRTGMDPLALFARPADQWQPYVRPILARYGGDVRTWQLGRADASAAFTRQDLKPVYAGLRAFFGQYVGDPRLLLPWRATAQLSAEARAAAGLTMHVPTSVRPGSLVDYADAWPDDGNLMVHLQTLGPERYSHRDRAIDLAQRMLHAWRAEPRRLAIDRPWSAGSARSPRRRAVPVPDPLLGVWVTLAEQLAGRRYVGQMELGEGRIGYLFDGPRGGLLAIWDDGPAEGDAELRIGLGGSPVAMDIWGNRRPVPREGEKHRLRLRQSPVLIEGLNMELARFRAGFRIEPSFLRSEYAAHEAELVLTNPWPQTITGRMRITGPADWEVRPRLQRLSIPSGETVRLPVEVSFPVNELAGPKELTAAFSLQSDQPYAMQISAPMEVGLKGIELDSSVEVRGVEGSADGAGEVRITLEARNVGEAVQSFYAFALPPGMARRQRIIASLEPGQTIVKRFRLKGAAEELSGQRIRVGIRQIDGPTMLNHELEVP